MPDKTSVIRRPGPMLIVLAFFVLSGLFRVGAQGMALAESASQDDETSVGSEQCEPAPDVAELLGKLQERQGQIAARETEIAERRQVLNIAEERIAEQMQALKQAEERLASTLAIADNAAENDISGLTEVYEKMKPKNAARIFETMEVSFAAGFLSRMRPEAAAGILSELPPNVAYSVSVIMAGRNANAPTE